MPQFDISLLETQNINIFSFCTSYLLYVKTVVLWLFTLLKLKYKLLLYVILYMVEELGLLLSTLNLFFYTSLPSFLKVRLLFVIVQCDVRYNTN